MSLHCSECEHWKQNLNKDVGNCDCISGKQFPTATLLCLRDKEDQNENMDIVPIRTKPNFGCIYAEPKKKT